MKKYLLIISMLASLYGRAQQVQPIEQTRENRVLTNRASMAKFFMGLPSADVFRMPTYVPDSVKAKSVWIKTGADRGLYIFNPSTGSLEKVGDGYSKAEVDAIAAGKANLNGGNVFSGTQTLNNSQLILTGAGSTQTTFQQQTGELWITDGVGGGITSIKNGRVYLRDGEGTLFPYSTAPDVTTIGDARYARLTGGNLISGDQTYYNKIYLHGDAVDALEPITKNQFDNYVTGITWKQEVRVATTGNITLSGTQTVDGVALVANDRVLVKSQTTQAQNGIYLVKSTAWTRAVDADDPTEIASAAVLVRLGTLNKNTQWTCTNIADPVMGTDPITFGQLAGAGTYVNDQSLTLTGNVFGVNYSTLDTRYLRLTGGTLTGPLYSTDLMGATGYVSSSYAPFVPGDHIGAAFKVANINNGPFAGITSYVNGTPDYRAGRTPGGAYFGIDYYSGSDFITAAQFSSTGITTNFDVLAAGNITSNGINGFGATRSGASTNAFLNYGGVVIGYTGGYTSFGKNGFQYANGSATQTLTFQYPTTTSQTLYLPQDESGTLLTRERAATSYWKLNADNSSTGTQTIGSGATTSTILNNVIRAIGTGAGVNSQTANGSDYTTLQTDYIYISKNFGATTASLSSTALSINSGVYLDANGVAFNKVGIRPTQPTSGVAGQGVDFYTPDKPRGTSYTLATTADILSYLNGTGLSLTGSTFSINQAFAPTWTGLHTFNMANLITTTVNAISVNNPTLSTSGVPVQVSPGLEFNSHVWNTTSVSDNTFGGRISLTPTSGTSPQAALIVSFNNNGGGYAGVFKLTNFGDLSVNSLVNTNASTNGQFSLNNTGALFVRNVADANAAFTVNNQHLSSTGNIQTWQWNAADRAGINRVGTFYTQNYALGSSISNAFLGVNPTAATSAVPVQYSPAFALQGSAWNTTTSATNSALWQIVNIPSSSATPSSVLNFISTMQGGTANTVFQLTSAGNINATAQIGVSRSGLATTPSIAFNAFNNTAATSGVPVQISPNYTYLGTGWQTGGTPQSILQFATTDLLPVSGATVSSNWRLGFSSGGAFNYPFTVSNTGIITTSAINTYSTGGYGALVRNVTTGEIQTTNSISNVVANSNVAATAPGTTSLYNVTADGNFKVGGFVSVSAVTLGSSTGLNLVISYTDLNSIGRSYTFNSTPISATGDYVFPNVVLRAKSGTPLVVFTQASNGSNPTSISFNSGAIIEKY